MNHRLLRSLVFAMLFAVSTIPSFAWGPMTHLAVNEQGYETAASRMGETCVISRALAHIFISGGPAPDVKFNGGDAFPREFHFSLETIDRMIDLAKTDARFGLQDVVEALGYAGHLYAEVSTAHAADGYPNNKISVAVPNSGYINHQISELAVDILTFDERSASLSKKAVIMPLRLMSAAMAAENAKNPEVKVMTPEQIKAAANAFLPTVVGVRTIAEYLRKNRPELLDEMNEYYADRIEAIDASVVEVAKMIETKGRKDFTKSFAGSIDGTDKVKIELQGEFKDKIKAGALNLLSASLKGEDSNNVFTRLSYGLIKGCLASSLWRDRFLTMIQEMQSKNLGGDARHQQIVSRVVMGMLARNDLSWPEILAFAQEGIDGDVKLAEKQRTQFAKLGLVENGRRRVTLADAIKAAEEVDHLEAVRNEWPWFWPFRPGDEKMALAREKASRLLGCAFVDNGFATGGLGADAAQLRASAKELRTKIYGYRDMSLIKFADKWNAFKGMKDASAKIADAEHRFNNLARISTALAANNDPSKVSKLVEQTQKRLTETEQALAAAQKLYNEIPKWNLIKRGKAKDELAKLEQARKGLNDYLSALKTIAEGQVNIHLDPKGNATTTAGLNGGYPVAVPAGQTTRAAQAAFEQAYREYVTLLQNKSGDDPAVKTALEKLTTASRERREAAAGTR